MVNFVDKEWEPKHVTIGLFEYQKMSGAALVETVKPLLKTFHLQDKVIAYVKDEGSNLVSLATALYGINFRMVVRLKGLLPASGIHV